jgi:hypothetical protein
MGKPLANSLPHHGHQGVARFATLMESVKMQLLAKPESNSALMA